jgi:hypothetical protein
MASLKKNLLYVPLLNFNENCSGHKIKYFNKCKCQYQAEYLFQSFSEDSFNFLKSPINYLVKEKKVGSYSKFKLIY